MACGVMMPLTPLLSSSSPMTRISAPTPSAPRYSMRPCPKGCSRSSGFWAMRTLMSDIMLPAASDRLLTASAVTASEPVSVPIMTFVSESRMFVPMPTADANVPNRLRTGWSDGFSPGRIRRCARRIMTSLQIGGWRRQAAHPARSASAPPSLHPEDMPAPARQCVLWADPPPLNRARTPPAISA